MSSEGGSKETTQNSGSVIRLLTGTIAGIVALACILMGGIYLFAVLLPFLYFGIKEYHKILKNKGFHPSLSLMYTASVLFVILVFFRLYDFIPCLLAFTVISSFLVVLFKGRQPYIANVATTALGAVYAGWLPTYIMLIIQYQTSSVNLFSIDMGEGACIAITIFLIVVATDVGAYHFGLKYGKHKLSPVISPKKTIEGAIGGAICAVITSLSGLINTHLTPFQCVMLGIITTVFAQLGDLSESLIKRDAGVKDSSNILPGHGGFLDRVDSYLFALPAAYYYIKYFTHGTNIILDGFQYIKGLFSAWGM